jgi:hypothetical protein
VFQKVVTRRIFRSERERENSSSSRKVCIKERHNLCASTNIVRLGGHVARTGKLRKASKILARTLGKMKHGIWKIKV